MKTYRLPSAMLDRFSSLGVTMDFLPEAVNATATRVTFAKIAAGGTLGRHAATLLQAFAVVEGDGEVALDDGGRHTVSQGSLVVWAKGEFHQTWATSPMLAIVVETDGSFDLDRHSREEPRQ